MADYICKRYVIVIDTYSIDSKIEEFAERHWLSFSAPEIYAIPKLFLSREDAINWMASNSRFGKDFQPNEIEVHEINFGTESEFDEL